MSIVKFEYDAATAVNGYKTYQIKLSDYGIRAGQRVGIICVGGGGAGGGVTNAYYGTEVAKGGDAGKGAAGGAGYGYGAGGGGTTGTSTVYDSHGDLVAIYIGTGGGGSGYLASDVITVTDAIAAATIVVSIGKGGTGGYSTGADGNPTSFGTYVTANGGVGGGGGNGGLSAYYRIYSYSGGSGYAKGGNGYGSATSGTGHGGGGAGGFIVGQPIAGNGENASAMAHGAGGGLTTGGGAQAGQNGGDGNGVCFMIWED